MRDQRRRLKGKIDLATTQLTQGQGVVRVLVVAEIGHGTVPGDARGDHAHSTAKLLDNVTGLKVGQARNSAEEVGHAEAEEQGSRGKVGFPGEGPHQESEDSPAEQVGSDGSVVVLGEVCIGSGDTKRGNEQSGVRDPVKT